MTRNPFGDPTGEQLVDGINSRFKSLFDAASFPLTDVGGTANDVTATVTPALDGDGLLDGMSFTITWAAENTGPMTLALNGGSPVPVLGVDGGGLPPGSVGPNLRSLVSYVGGDFVLLSASLLAGGAGAARYYWAFEASGTWEKPEGLPADTPVRIQGWGGGGGGGSGSNSSGGGGSGYKEAVVRAGDLPSSVTVVVADGGAVNAAGGDSTFGSFLIAYGGGAGLEDASGINGQRPGTGGGELERGGSFILVNTSTPRARIGGGNYRMLADLNIDETYGFDVVGAARSIWGGGSGAIRGAGGLHVGGMAVFGGGGGASTTQNSGQGGGLSIYGGNGGARGQAGSAPGGGGSAGNSGGRGEIRIWI